MSMCIVWAVFRPGVRRFRQQSPDRMRQQHTVQPAPQQPQPAPPQQAQPPVAPGPASDLMDLGAPRAEPTPPSPPVALDRERLRAEREAWEKQQARVAVGPPDVGNQDRGGTLESRSPPEGPQIDPAASGRSRPLALRAPTPTR